MLGLSRRVLLRSGAGFGLAAALLGRSRAAIARPIVGAIRWDAWYAPDSETGRAVENALGPERYHFRLPFFANVDGPDKVTIDGGHQEIMDQEIRYAADAGLDYWAFLGYETGDPMSKGLELYLSSTVSNRIKFCLMAELGRWGFPGRPSPMAQRHQALLLDPRYQTVLDGRPLYFLGFIDEAKLQDRWHGAENLKDAITRFREVVQKGGGRNPYIVIMDSDAGRAATLMNDLGGDAVSCYAHAPKTSRGMFTTLEAAAERHWDAEAQFGVPVVPTIVTGWDRRPRIDHPVPWQKSQAPGAGADNYYDTATPSQIADELRSCLSWIDQHPNATQARTALIYAWDENDEGGWLIPTYHDDHSRLDAIRSVLRGA